VTHWKDYSDEGEEEDREEDCEENCEEEKEVANRRVHPLSSATMMSATRAIWVILLLSSVTAAHAVSITNRDERDYRVTVIEGEAKADHVLKPLQTLTDICLKGCTIRINDSADDDYRLTASDVVAIEDGTVYYEGPDASAGPPPPPAPAKKPGNRG
jgi:hypothetical protein